MSDYEKRTQPNLDTLAKDLQSVEHLPGIGHCLAWELDQVGQAFPSELARALVKEAMDGKTVMLDVRYREDDVRRGLLFGTAMGADGVQSLQFVDYSRVEENGETIRVQRYTDSKSLGLGRFQQR